MFAHVIASRPVSSDFQQVDATHVVCDIIDAVSVNHICVFLTQTLPANVGASVHFQFVNSGWKLLGVLTNEKPSAIFKLKGFDQIQNLGGSQSSMSIATTQGQRINAQLGISLEPIDQVQNQMAEMQRARQSQQQQQQQQVSIASGDKQQIAESILRQLYEFITSFVSDIGTQSNATIPLRAFQEWYNKMTTKIKNGLF
ncbi:hypothetical protein MP228_001379 [Amoeboaphelidium protococcarum]|nr:hypothetical protein MP228_001379 [Amoeboaphelidium protococcarum]